MTVVSMMSFGDSGAAVADELASMGEKKYLLTKIRMLAPEIIFGGSGSDGFLEEIFNAALGYAEKQQKAVDIDDYLTYIINASSALKMDRIDKSLTAALGGITYQNLQTGTLPDGTKMDDFFRTKGFEYVKSDEIQLATTNSFMLGGFDISEKEQEKRFEIFFADCDGNLLRRDRRRFRCIGNGGPTADAILEAYKNSRSREKRDDISEDEGLVKLIQATNTAIAYVNGVGGTPKIIYLKSRQTPREPSENQCNLCGELVNGLEWGYLNREFVYDAVKRVVINNAQFESTEKEMIGVAGEKWPEFDHRLRGYKNHHP